jgi:DNA-directed RNA polymerase specialized sigma24 family protein
VSLEIPTQPYLIFAVTDSPALDTFKQQVKIGGPDMKVEAESQLRDVRDAILRIGGDVGEESYQQVCRYALSSLNIDWTRPQRGRLIRLAERIVRCERYKVRHPPKNRPRCFSDISTDFDPERWKTDSGVDDRRSRLEELMTVLTPPRRFALQCFMEGMPDEEIAASVGIRADLVRQWRHRDTERLRRIVQQAGC